MDNNNNEGNEQPTTVTTNGVITDIGLYEPRFESSPAGAYEIGVDIKREDNGETIQINLEVSMAMCGFKSDDMTRYAFAVQTLKGIGYEHDDDFSAIDSLIGKVVAVYGKKQYSKKTGKEYWSWNFSQASARKKIDVKSDRMSNLLAQFRAMKAGTAKPVDDNPFG